jgi:hypothetical protein
MDERDDLNTMRPDELPGAPARTGDTAPGSSTDYFQSRVAQGREPLDGVCVSLCVAPVE